MEKRARIDTSFNWLGEPAVLMRAGGYEAVVVPSVGGNMISLQDGSRKLDALRSPPSLVALRESPQIYGLPLLFLPNRIAEGTFSADGRNYRLPIHETARRNHLHGFLHRKSFTVVRADIFGDGSPEETAAELELSFLFNSDAPEFSYFPHAFRATQLYRLSREGLSHRIVFRNEGRERMPFGVGVHSNFRIPFSTGSGPHDCSMRASIVKKWEVDENFRPTGRLPEFDELDRRIAGAGFDPQSEPLKGRCYSSGSIEGRNARFNGAVVEDRHAGLRLVYEADEIFKFWVIWNMDGSNGFVSIEPQSWVINAPNLDLPESETGMALLEPGSVWQGSCRLRLQDA